MWKERKINLTKIVAYLSCSAGRTLFARTNNHNIFQFCIHNTANMTKYHQVTKSHHANLSFSCMLHKIDLVHKNFLEYSTNMRFQVSVLIELIIHSLHCNGFLSSWVTNCFTRVTFDDKTMLQTQQGWADLEDSDAFDTRGD